MEGIQGGICAHISSHAKQIRHSGNGDSKATEWRSGEVAPNSEQTYFTQSGKLFAIPTAFGNQLQVSQLYGLSEFNILGSTYVCQLATDKGSVIYSIGTD